MEQNAIIAVIIFTCSYALIVSEKIHRTIVALVGAALMILAGIINQDVAIHHVDFNTLGVLVGMMIIVNVTAETGLFNYLAIWSAKKAKGEPKKLLIVLSLLTAVCSALVGSVTTVLLTVPVTFSITSQLKISPKPFLMAQILASNIGGASTMVGDPPNVMLGSAVKELDFLAFITNLTDICFVILLATIGMLLLIYRKELHTQEEFKVKIMSLNEKSQIHNAVLLKKCLAVLVVTITLFAMHSFLHIETATAALAGASLLLMMSFHEDEPMLVKVFSKVEWLSIFFFTGLFILVGALVETGVIKMLAAEAMVLTQGNVTLTSMLIIWSSAVASSVVDNVPFVATMIPLIKDMGAMGMPNLEPLWWSLSLGTCLGGNGTLVGASSNVVVASLASQHGEPVSFIKYFLVGMPLMLMSIAIASVFIYLRFL